MKFFSGVVSAEAYHRRLDFGKRYAEERRTYRVYPEEFDFFFYFNVIIYPLIEYARNDGRFEETWTRYNLCVVGDGVLLNELKREKKRTI